MILGLALILALPLRVACGAGWREIGQLRIRGEAQLLWVLALVAIFPVVAAPFELLRRFAIPVWLLLMGLLLVLCLLNVTVSPGFRLLSAGVALNLVVVTANGGMPVSPVAARSAGGVAAVAAATAGGDVFHSITGQFTYLQVLSDVLPLPSLPGIRAILSVGDVLMLVGVVVVLTSFRRQDVPSSP